MSVEIALLVIDMQVGMVNEAEPIYRGQELLETIRDLIDRAHQAGVPVIYIQHGSERDGHPLQIGTSGWQIHPAIVPQEGDLIIQKRMPDSFYQTGLHQALSTRGIKKLILAGVQTEYCVDTTCRRACSLDYDVILVQDAHSTWDTELLTAQQIIAHHNAILGDWFATAKMARDIAFS